MAAVPSSPAVLLTGATGYLGSHLADAMLAQGYRVVALVRSRAKLSYLAPLAKQIELVEASELSALPVDRKFDVVVHTAASYGRNGDTPADVCRANLLFGIEVLQAALRCGARGFLYSGTSLPPEHSLYALSKNQFVQWADAMLAGSPVRFTQARLEHFYGPDDDAGKFTTHVIRSCLSNVADLNLTAGTQQRDFVYISDAVAGMMLLVDRLIAGTAPAPAYPLGSGTAVTVRQFVERVHTLAASTTKLNFGAVPMRAGEALFTQADNTQLAALGWRPRVALDEGIRLTLAAEKARGHA